VGTRGNVSVSGAASGVRQLLQHGGGQLLHERGEAVCWRAICFGVWSADSGCGVESICWLRKA
jgi:hypothetical protein